MKHRLFFLIVLFLFMHHASDAQQYRFVYIQTENKQPFYIRITEAVYSSSASGYIIIPKLKDGSYQFIIGFPRNEWPQQTFTININKKDIGYLLKNVGEKGWALFNLQTMELQNARTTIDKKSETGDIDDDPFTQILSDVVNSPDLKKKKAIPAETVKVPVKTDIKKEEPVVVRQEPVIKKEDPVIPKQEPVVKKEEPVRTPEPAIPAAFVKQLVNIKDKEGRVMVYLDGLDTIRLFIPAQQSTVKTGAVKTEEKSEGKEKFIDLELPNPNSKKEATAKNNTAEIKDAPVVTVPSEKTSNPSGLMYNSDCTANANEEDFMKLRKKMAAADSDDEMIKSAKKGFKAKCYSTAQIKNLSVLFLNDAGRYQFFDTAYPFVYDTGNFSTLEQQLTDPYFITRFQAMIRR